ncbi:MAG: CDP-4-dehydro-6-deoxyglucose reductase [Planctomycetota bacterium]
MNFQIKVLSSGQVFSCPGDVPVLSAALQANILMSYGCRQGMCGSCRGHLADGKITYKNGFPDAITAEDAEAGFVLFCSAYPESDLLIEIVQPAPAIDQS